MQEYAFTHFFSSSTHTGKVMMIVGMAGPSFTLQGPGAHIAREIDGGGLLGFGLHFREMTEIANERPAGAKNSI